jgi:2-phosphoglycerate kinase
MTLIDKLPIQSVVEYEVASSWWAPYISNTFLQDLAAKYMLWKTIRKMKRYKKFLYLRRKLELKKALYQN